MKNYECCWPLRDERNQEKLCSPFQSVYWLMCQEEDLMVKKFSAEELQV